MLSLRINKTMNKYILGLLIVLSIAFVYQTKAIHSLKTDLNVERNNTEALFSSIEHYQIDSAKKASVVRGLQLSIDDYEKYRKSDLETIGGLKLKIKNIESVSKTKLGVYAQIVSELQDTLVVKDSLLVEAKKVSMNDGYLDFNGVIVGDTLTADFSTEVELNQAFYTTYKWKFLWWKGPVKDIRQVIVTNNPHVELKYSEYIKIR